MALLDRVATLIRANLNDLIDKAEDPEKLLKQLFLDMQNQFMQVKTQVAMAVADQLLLQKKQAENMDAQREWVRRAELAISKNQDDLARVALERSLTFENAARSFAGQIDTQAHQVQILRDALNRLEQKMTETKSQTEILIASHRRARLALHAGVSAAQQMEHDATFDRLRSKVDAVEALGQGHLIANSPSVESRLAAMDRSDQVDRLLADLKMRRLNGAA